MLYDRVMMESRKIPWTRVLIMITLMLSPLLVTALQETNPLADYWRQVRQGVEGYSAVQGQETGELIQGSGQSWRQIRNGPIATYGAGLMVAITLALGVFYLLRGQVKLTRGRLGKTVVRWQAWERYLHWYTAILFLILAITGISLLYGRAVLIPVLGHASFATYAGVAKLIHNYAGPLFIVGLVVMLFSWFKVNMPHPTDINWLKEMGGMVGDKHPSAGRINAGEKLWFWSLFFAGLGVAVSGLVLDFPVFGQQRELIQLAHISHTVLGIILIAFSLAHIYIGTIGTEGALEGMVTGEVDVNWAKQHHDLWYEELPSKRASDDPATTDQNSKVQRLT